MWTVDLSLAAMYNCKQNERQCYLSTFSCSPTPANTPQSINYKYSNMNIVTTAQLRVKETAESDIDS